MPVSSMFQIFDGLSSKLLVEITDPSSSKYLSNTSLDVHLALTSDSFLGFPRVTSGCLALKPVYHDAAKIGSLSVFFPQTYSKICCQC